MPKISHERLKELVSYNPCTGDFYLLKTKSRQLVNKLPYLLGRVPNGAGYREAMLEWQTYRLHILAYFYMTGRWPPEGAEVDHKDRDPLNNRWENLRLLSKGENIRNQAQVRSNTKSGHTGITIKSEGIKRFKAYIGLDCKLYHLGSFLTLEEALAARAKALEARSAKTCYET